MRSILWMALALVATPMVLTACGGEDGPMMMPPPMDGDSGTVTPPAPGKVMLNIELNLPAGMVIPNGSLVTVGSDSFALTTPPMQIPVDPGMHAVDVNVTGWRSRAVTVEAGMGQPNIAHVPMARERWDGLNLACGTEPRGRHTELSFPESQNVIRLRCFLGDGCDAFEIDGDHFAGLAGVAVVEGSVNPEFTEVQYTVDGVPDTCRPSD